MHRKSKLDTNVQIDYYASYLFSYFKSNLFS